MVMALTALVAVFAFLGAWLAFQLLQHSLTPNAVKAILMFSAFKMKSAEGVELDELIQGAGAINAAERSHSRR
jgi:hypothetical protein